MTTDQSRGSSGTVFVGKLLIPLLLFLISSLAAFPIRGVVTAAIFLTTIVPLILIGAFFLAVPGQLRSDGGVISFRRWFRWQTLPTDEIETIEKVLFLFGALKLAGRDRRLIFFVEPENRYLLGFGAGNEALHTRIDAWLTYSAPQRVSVDLLSGTAGFVVGIFWSSLVPPLAPTAVGPRWVMAVITFADNHSYIPVVIVIVVLALLIGNKRIGHIERGLAVFLMGMMASRLFA